jgi:hypothetical protein
MIGGAGPRHEREINQDHENRRCRAGGGSAGMPHDGGSPGTMVRDADRRLTLQRGLCRYSACVQVDPGRYRWECGAARPEGAVFR